MIAGLTSRVFPLSAPVKSCCLSRRGDALGLALSNGRLALFPADDTADAAKILPLYPDSDFLLVPDADDHALLTGGSDGRVFIIDPTFDIPTEIAQAATRITALAGGASGFRAYATQDQIALLTPEGDEQAVFATTATTQKIVFSPDGNRWTARTEAGLYTGLVTETEAPVFIPATGLIDILAQTSSPNLLALSDHGLQFYTELSSATAPICTEISRSPHAFALTDRTSSYLFTGGPSGAMGFALSSTSPFITCALTLGPDSAGPVCAIAPHPRDPFVALGYQSGLVLLAPLDGRMEMTLRPASAQNGVCGMGWSAFGDCLFVAMDSGQLLLYVARSRRAPT